MTAAASKPNDREALTVHMDEYRALKAEQSSRIGFRDNLMYATLGAVGAAGWGAVQQDRPALLLVIPLACSALGWTYLRNDSQITRIRSYIRGTLRPRITRIIGDSDIFDWETVPDDRCRNTRRWIQLVVDLAVFFLPGLTACTIVNHYQPGPGITALIAVAVLMTAAVGGQIITDSDVRLNRPAWLRRRGGAS